MHVNDITIIIRHQYHFPSSMLFVIVSYRPSYPNVTKRNGSNVILSTLTELIGGRLTLTTTTTTSSASSSVPTPTTVPSTLSTTSTISSAATATTTTTITTPAAPVSYRYQKKLVRNKSGVLVCVKAI